MPAEGDPANNATARTLNYALGNLGGRQKSWMAAPNSASNPPPSPLTARIPALPSPVRKRGRPPKNQTQTAAPAHSATEPQAERQPLSKSTSPQLANVMTPREFPRQRPPSVTVFPSPTPSEETMDITTAPALRGGHAAANLDFLELDQVHANYAHDPPLETVFMDEVQRAGSAPKRSSEGDGGQAEKRNRTNGDMQPSPPVSTPQCPDFPRRPSAPQAHITSPHLAQAQSRSPSLGQLHNGQVGSHSIQGRLVAGTPPVPQAPTRPCAGYHSNWCTSAECTQVLRAFQATFAVSANRPRDETRINVLRDATDREDWDYLIMHQFYCLLDYNPTLLPKDLRNKPGLNQALRILQDVLDSNNHLSPAVLHFFSNYPYPLQEILARWPATLEHYTRKFCSFIAHSPNYDRLRLTCESRRFPPVAWELAHCLALSSITFQCLLFTAFLRCIWRGVPRDNPLQVQYEKRAVALFAQSQDRYYKRVAQAASGQFPASRNVLQDNEIDLRHSGQLLQQLVEEFESRVRQQGYPVSSRYVPVSVPLVQQPQPQQAQRDNRISTTAADMANRVYRQAQPHTAQAATQQNRGRGRPRVPPLPPAQVLPSTPQRQQPRAPAKLLPPPGTVLPQQRTPTPARLSLHQANLRSPVLEIRSLDGPFCHFMQGYMVPPARVSNANRAVEKWSFTLDAHTANRIAAAISGPPGPVDRRVIDSKSRTVRIRCIKWPGSKAPDEHTWTITDTSWIPYSYFTFNGTSLQQRKKIHHGKDLPIDITGLVRQGENILEMAVMTGKTDNTHQKYLVAIEFLGVISHEAIKRQCLTQSRVPANQSLDTIRQKLMRGAEDEELAIVESNLTINLFDPFSASNICDIPVRSKACLHNDCFDLETFLKTRTRKGDVSIPDGWRCPICNGDARPNQLIVDGFLQDVKSQLDARNLSKTRAIIVQQDGSWMPKPEVRDPNGVSDRGQSDEPPTPSTARASLPAQVEIIDLSD
ncbi:hypothetical protein EK21DRAFT_59641 [Setomelanomma holmii]|uniref:SP-RING-type domain-containing protein n=1 Tax=Setomelanomma holmii TaxID=210430 RepID=A0A9P4HGN3_9PLEO|nr:hypothetical protein EK21DRAFT_59641 [Setomelanomma holmii]